MCGFANKNETGKYELSAGDEVQTVGGTFSSFLSTDNEMISLPS